MDHGLGSHGAQNPGAGKAWLISKSAFIYTGYENEVDNSNT
jgi:hypothetical protein